MDVGEGCVLGGIGMSCVYEYAKVTEMERFKAKKIVSGLRKNNSRKKVAELLRIKEIYVSFAEYDTKTPTGRSLCPHSVIKHILEFDRIINSRIE